MGKKGNEKNQPRLLSVYAHYTDGNIKKKAQNVGIFYFLPHVHLYSDINIVTGENVDDGVFFYRKRKRGKVDVFFLVRNRTGKWK